MDYNILNIKLSILKSSYKNLVVLTVLLQSKNK